MKNNVSNIQQYLRDNQLFTQFDLHKIGFLALSQEMMKMPMILIY
jgi:hypothetical protein